jgi:hypothetical protein
VNKGGKAVVNNELASFVHRFTIRFCAAFPHKIFTPYPYGVRLALA